MAKPKGTHQRVLHQVKLASSIALLMASGFANAVDWRVVIASVDVVVMVDADTFRRNSQQLVFRSAAYQPKPEADGSIGDVSNLTFDCAGRRMQTDQTLNIRLDGSTVPTKDEKVEFVAVPSGSMAALFLDRMCRIKPEGNKMNGVLVFVAPEIAAKSIFGPLQLGLNSEQASELATRQYFDEPSLLRALDTGAVTQAKRTAVRKVLTAQTVQTPPSPPPIVPLPSAVATGKVGKYTYSA